MSFNRNPRIPLGGGTPLVVQACLNNPNLVGQFEIYTLGCQITDLLVTLDSSFQVNGDLVDLGYGFCNHQRHVEELNKLLHDLLNKLDQLLTQ
jgi:hypothetical protein